MLGIELAKTEIELLTDEVHWAVVDAQIDEVREALHVPREPTQASW